MPILGLTRDAANDANRLAVEIANPNKTESEKPSNLASTSLCKKHKKSRLADASAKMQMKNEIKQQSSSLRAIRGHNREIARLLFVSVLSARTRSIRLKKLVPLGFPNKRNPSAILNLSLEHSSRKIPKQYLSGSPCIGFPNTNGYLWPKRLKTAKMLQDIKVSATLERKKAVGKKLLIFGKVAKDYIISEFPFRDFNERIKREETNSVGNISEYWGGSGLNVAAASSFNCLADSVQTILFTQSGSEFDPETIALNTLCKNLGITIFPIEESYIPKICVLVESGSEKKRTFLSGSNGRMSFDINSLSVLKRDAIIEHSKDAYAVVLAGLTPGSPFASIDMRLLLNQMKEQNPDLIIALDLIASDFGEAQLSIFSSADYLLPSDAELPLLIDDVALKNSLRKELQKQVLDQDEKIFDAAAKIIFEKFKSLTLLAVKRGKAGSRVYKRMVGSNKLNVWWRESISEEKGIKDTTGAGDSWIGAFMASDALTHHPGNSASFGNVIARYCISRLGAINWRNQKIDCDKTEKLARLVPGGQYLF